MRSMSQNSLMNLETDERLSENKFRPQMEHFNRVVTLRGDDVIMDLGGGVGLWSEYFSKRVRHVILVEKQKEFVDVARKKFSEQSINNVEIIYDDIVNFDVIPGSVDKVFISGVTIYLNDDALTALSNKIRHALREGGELIHRDSYGGYGRYVIDNKFSEKLDMTYSAIYRSFVNEDAR